MSMFGIKSKKEKLEAEIAEITEKINGLDHAVAANRMIVAFGARKDVKAQNKMDEAKYLKAGEEFKVKLADLQKQLTAIKNAEAIEQPKKAVGKPVELNLKVYGKWLCEQCTFMNYDYQNEEHKCRICGHIPGTPIVRAKQSKIADPALSSPYGKTSKEAVLNESRQQLVDTGKVKGKA
jgi:rubrerythrin